MAGHSKWANIKHQKARTDAKKSKIFTKLIRELVVAARRGGVSVDLNFRLRTAVESALQQNMPRSTIDRAIQRGVGDTDSNHLESIVYEGYGPEGVAFWIECLSDNRNRTAAAVRHALNKLGGDLGSPGSVAYLFKKRGRFLIDHPQDAAVMDQILSLAWEDLEEEGTASLAIIVSPEEFEAVRVKLLALKAERGVHDWLNCWKN